MERGWRSNASVSAPLPCERVTTQSGSAVPSKGMHARLCCFCSDEHSYPQTSLCLDHLSSCLTLSLPWTRPQRPATDVYYYRTCRWIIHTSRQLNCPLRLFLGVCPIWGTWAHVPFVNFELFKGEWRREMEWKGNLFWCITYFRNTGHGVFNYASLRLASPFALPFFLSCVETLKRHAVQAPSVHPSE